MGVVPPDNYGYKVDISNPQIKELYFRFKKWKGIPDWCPLSDEERFEFETYILGEKRKESRSPRIVEQGNDRQGS